MHGHGHVRRAATRYAKLPRGRSLSAGLASSDLRVRRHSNDHKQDRICCELSGRSREMRSGRSFHQSRALTSVSERGVEDRCLNRTTGFSRQHATERRRRGGGVDVDLGERDPAGLDRAGRGGCGSVHDTVLGEAMWNGHVNDNSDALPSSVDFTRPHPIGNRDMTPGQPFYSKLGVFLDVAYSAVRRTARSFSSGRRTRTGTRPRPHPGPTGVRERRPRRRPGPTRLGRLGA